MDTVALGELSRRASRQVFEHILPFWSGPAVDHEQGGWMGWLDNDLIPDRSQPKGLIVNSRILWSFSAAHRLRPEALYRQMAGRALEYVLNRFWDEQHGGAYWRLDDRGRVLEDVKKTYGQAFCLYALVEYAQAFGSAVALQRAIELFELVERHAHDPVHQGYFEVASRDWSEILNAPLSERDMNEKKSMNSHLHVLEAYTRLYAVSQEPRVGVRLRELIGLFQDRILNRRTWHLEHFFDEQWRVRSDNYTFGHDIEASWLLCEAAETLGDEALLAAARATALRLAETVLAEAVDATGGLCYEGRAGAVVDSRKECWPQAEAAVGFLNAFQLSRDPRFFAAARGAWDYIENHLVDRTRGEWFWRTNADGRPDPALPKVSEWKGPYHGTRMCLETVHRVEALGGAPA